MAVRVLCFIILAGLVACGSTATTPTADVAPTQTRAAELAQLATLTVPTATLTPTASATPTGTPIPTSTTTPTVTVVPSPTLPQASPTATSLLISPTSTPLPAQIPAGGYATNFSTWYTGQDSQARFFIDPNTGEYRIANLEQNLVVPELAPEGFTFQDFVLEVTVRRIVGPDAGSYGLEFRRQPLQVNDKRSTRYSFHVTPSGFFSLDLVTSDRVERIQPLTFSPAINRGNAFNRLTVTCQGDKIILAINGVRVGTYTATLLDPGTIAVVVVTPPHEANMEAAFSNLRLFPLP